MRARTFLEHDYQQPVGGGDPQHVHDDGLDGQDDAAKGHGQQYEREHYHQPDDDRQFLLRLFGDVDDLRAQATDEHVGVLAARRAGHHRLAHGLDELERPGRVGRPARHGANDRHIAAPP